MASTGSALRALSCATFLLVSLATAQIRVVTTTPDLADLARRIGGSSIRVESLTRGHEDLHAVRIRPSALIKLRRADCFIQLGLDAEHAWVPPLLRNARNRRILPGGAGFCNASRGVEPLKVPKDKTRRIAADLHPRGNPHFNLDPRRMRTAARNVHACLLRLLPAKKKELDTGLARWEKELAEHRKKWSARLAPFKKSRFVEYHDAWVYFADCFDLVIVGQLESKPGLAPSAAHLVKLEAAARKEGVGLIVSRPQNAAIARRVAEKIGAKAEVLQLGSGDSGETRGWFQFMDRVVETFATRLRKR